VSATLNKADDIVFPQEQWAICLRMRWALAEQSNQLLLNYCMFTKFYVALASRAVV